MKVDFYKHNLGKEEKDSIDKVIDSTFISTGPVTKCFEESFAKYLNAKYCVAVSNWTLGSFLVLKALGIGSGDEVITTPMSFIATSNSIIHAGAKPIFVDVEENTGNLDVSNIENSITEKTKAIMPVHLYGQMCDMIAINEIAKKHELYVIEDCAHCIEGQREMIRPGQLSTAAVFSFYATKNITSGEGGAIVTNNYELYEKLLKYRSHGMSKGAAERHTSKYQHWDMELLGYNCKISDIQSSLLLPQLKSIDNNLKIREKICTKYEHELNNIKGVEFPNILKSTKHARHLFSIWVAPRKRDKIIHHLQSSNVGVTVNYRSIHLLSYYRTMPDIKKYRLPNSEKIGNSTITLPMYPKITTEEIKYVSSVLKKIV